jgi:hypothetical protein
MSDAENRISEWRRGALRASQENLLIHSRMENRKRDVEQTLEHQQQHQNKPSFSASSTISSGFSSSSTLSSADLELVQRLGLGIKI